MAVQDVRDLEVWRQSMDLAVHCYRATKSFPKEEIYGLTSQIRRAAISVPANITEGQCRETTKDFLKFLSIANGSLKELETHRILSQMIGLLPQAELESLLERTTSVGRMLTGPKQALRKRL